MTTYSPEIHTPDALNAEIARIYTSHPEALLVGSLGRAAAFNNLGHDPQVEFNYRRQNPLFAGSHARDIDIIPRHHGPIADKPFEIDDQVFYTPRAKLVSDGGDWFLVSDRRKFYEPLHPAVMEPQAAETVYGIKCMTVSLQTHLALFGLKGLMGPKVVQSLELTRKLGSASQLTTHEELYIPFEKLKALDLQGVYPFLQRHYRNLVPEDVRAKLCPVTRPLKNLLP